MEEGHLGEEEKSQHKEGLEVTQSREGLQNQDNEEIQ